MAQQDGQYAIETISLTKIFPDWWGRSKVVAVEDLDLKIHHNEVYGLLGPNGSGKTTTLKMLFSLLHPTRGKALLLGGSSRDSKIKSRIGYLPEESYLYRYLNAYETLDFYGRIFDIPSQERKSRIEALLEMVGLQGMANRPIGTYSKGMARRIGLAQALINDPDVLILDEPTSGMDPLGTRQMKDLILELAKRGKTILLCSHLLADVEDVCDRIGILYGGRMQVEGHVDSLLQHKQERQILTGTLSESATEQIRQIIEAENSKYEISCPMDRLEDFFVDTVTKAVEQNKPTSGAVSTTQIGGFLAQEEKRENILDQLVSWSEASPSGPPQRETVDSTQQTQPPAEKESRPDEGLLQELSKGGADTTKPEPVAKETPTGTKSIETEAPARPAEPDKNLLDSLVERKDSGNAETNPTDSGQTEEPRDE